MKISSFLFGLGCGFVFLSVLLYFIYGYQLRAAAASDADIYISDEEIIERAKRLGMVTVSEAVMNRGTPDNVKNTEPEPTEPEPMEPEPMEPEPTEPEPAEAEPPEPEPTEPEPEPPEPGIGSASAEGLIFVEIPRGIAANDVAVRLYDAGVLSDTKGFIDFLSKEAATRSIVYGSYYFYKDEPFESILEKIRLAGS